MRKWAIAVAATVMAVLWASPGQAAAVNVLTYGSLGGANAATGDVIQSGLAAGARATFFNSTTGSTGITCTVSTFTATVTGNPAAGGVATANLTAQTFTSCTANVSGVTCVQSIVINNLPYSVSVNGTTKSMTLTGAPLRSTIRLCTVLGVVQCVYDANLNTISGTVSNADNSVTFVNQRLNKATGPGVCFSIAYFSAKYAPVRGPGGSLVFTQ
ncbi:Tat pathway signal sequence domain protein [Allorhizocola rhizosphaerae]|uniref:Tat pathway signal sequence domain protein n=1 Tax=Allorhizocola rhizosphaerae TaxID=1872709 RepID=UPI000E3EDB27|nr:Tat pathway signal sequence domain protein [Allorhizocola rhizosphaerae]